MIVFLCVLYVLIASFFIFALVVAAKKICDWDSSYDLPWPIFCGILWPVFGPFAIAYIAAKWYMDNEHN